MRRSREKRLRRVTWAAALLNGIACAVHVVHYGLGEAASHGLFALAHLALLVLLVPTRRRLY